MRLSQCLSSRISFQFWSAMVSFQFLSIVRLRSASMVPGVGWNLDWSRQTLRIVLRRREGGGGEVLVEGGGGMILLVGSQRYQSCFAPSRDLLS